MRTDVELNCAEEARGDGEGNLGRAEEHLFELRTQCGRKIVLGDVLGDELLESLDGGLWHCGLGSEDLSAVESENVALGGVDVSAADAIGCALELLGACTKAKRHADDLAEEGSRTKGSSGRLASAEDADDVRQVGVSIAQRASSEGYGVLSDAVATVGSGKDGVVVGCEDVDESVPCRRDGLYCGSVVCG